MCSRKTSRLVILGSCEILIWKEGKNYLIKEKKNKKIGENELKDGRISFILSQAWQLLKWKSFAGLPLDFRLKSKLDPWKLEAERWLSLHQARFGWIDCTLGRTNLESTCSVPGHSLVLLLICSHHSFISLLSTTRCACALCLACSLGLYAGLARLACTLGLHAGLSCCAYMLHLHVLLRLYTLRSFTWSLTYLFPGSWFELFQSIVN